MCRKFVDIYGEFGHPWRGNQFDSAWRCGQMLRTHYPVDEGTATSVPVWFDTLVIVLYLTALSGLKGEVKLV